MLQPVLRRRFPPTIVSLLALAATPFFSTGAAAQEGTIAYTQSVKVDFELPPEIRQRLEAAGRGAGGPGGDFLRRRTNDVVLIFDGEASLMRTVPRTRPERGGRPSGPPSDNPRAQRMRGFMERMRMNSASRQDRETVVGAWVDLDADSIIEVREFLGRTFRIAGPRPAFQWRLTGEQAEFLGYPVMKAVAEHDSSTVEAWFTPQIPIPGGPGPYGGLPGMILVVSVDEGRVQYSATQVSLTEVADGVIVRPDEGEVVSREEYEAIVAEKLEELRTVGGGPGGS